MLEQDPASILNHAIFSWNLTPDTQNIQNHTYTTPINKKKLLPDKNLNFKFQRFHSFCFVFFLPWYPKVLGKLFAT